AGHDGENVGPDGHSSRYPVPHRPAAQFGRIGIDSVRSVFCIQIMPPTMRPIQPEPDLSERIHDAVLDAICSGELKAGARITQEELAKNFGVSRQPVLQAMMLLRREGFLIDAGRKGVQVAPLDMQQVKNLYVVRGALDGAAARLAAANYTPELAHRGRL